MTKVTKLFSIGASSMSFRLGMFRAIPSNGELSDSALTLVGRNLDKLARTAGLARLLNETASSATVKLLAALWVATRRYNRCCT